MLVWVLLSLLMPLLMVPFAASHQWSLLTRAVIVTAAFTVAGFVQYIMKGRPSAMGGE